MKLFIALSLLFSFAAVAAAPVPANPFPYKCLGGTNDAGSIGGCQLLVPSTDSSWFSLYAGIASATSDRVYPFYRGLTAAGVSTSGAYQVPAGKTLECVGPEAKGSSVNSGYQLMSDSVVFASAATVASLTAPFYQCGASAIYCRQLYQTANVVRVENYTFKFSASRFPGVQLADNTQTYLFAMLCREI